MIEQLKIDKKQGGVTCGKGPHAGRQTWGHCSEDEASAHGTPALPTKLNGAPATQGLLLYFTFLNPGIVNECYKRESFFASECHFLKIITTATTGFQFPCELVNIFGWII